MAPGATPVHLYLTPFLRLYLLAHLGDLQKAGTQEASRVLWEELERTLGGRLLRVTNDWHDRPSQVSRVELWMQLREGVDLDAGRRHRIERAQAIVGRRFFGEMYSTVDWYRRVLHLRARVALEMFRAQYAISEEDYHFHSMERTYQKHCARAGITRKRSGRKRRAVAGRPSQA